MNGTIDLKVLSRGGGDARSDSAVAIPGPPSRWKTRVLLPAVLLLGVGGLVAYSARDALVPARPVSVVSVVVKGVQETAGGATVQAPGWVEPDPYSIQVTALADGIVKEVHALEGQWITKGQVVARLIEDEAQLSRERALADLQAAEGDLKMAEAALVAAQKEWDNPTERTRAVASTEALLAMAGADLARWPAEVAVEEARYNEMREEYERKKAARESNAVGEFEMIQAKLRAEAQRAMVDAIKAKRPVMEAKVKEQEAELAAARENLRLRIAEEKALAEAKSGVAKAREMRDRSRAMRDEANLRLARMDVVSPVDGMVLQRYVEPGSRVMFSSDMPTSAVVVKLYDPKKLQVRVDVPLADAGGIGVGQKCKVVVGVLPDKQFDGEVTRLVQEADLQKNTVQFKVRIADPAPELRPEMLARVRFLATPKEGAAAKGESRERVFVPEKMVKDGTVWIVDGEGKARRRTVTPGETRMEGWISVTAGLMPGDRVVADPGNLQDGERVRITGDAGTTKGGGHGAH